MKKHLLSSFRWTLPLGAAAATALLLASPAPAAAQSLTVDQANGNSPYAFTVSASYGFVEVGHNGIGVLNHSANTLTTFDLDLGENIGSNGSYNLTGGALLTEDEYIGFQGTGTFTQSGGTHTVSRFFNIGFVDTSSGSYTLSGTGALSLVIETIGSSGTGTFSQSGGTHTVSENLYLGFTASGSGSYTLSAGDLSAPQEFIGYSGSSTFLQTGGTNTVSGTLFLSNRAGSSGLYHLNGGTLMTNLVTGGLGTSTFNFSSGTLRAGATSTTFFQGLTTANVRVGGAKIDTNGFDITVAQPLLHDTNVGAPPTDGGLTKSGAGTLTLTGANTYNGPTTVSAGTLLAQNTSGNATGSGTVGVSNGGTLGGSGSVGRVTVASGGTVAPGNSAGRLTVNGNYTQANGGALTIELGGATPGTQHDQLAVTGQAQLSGRLNVSLINGFQPTAGATFQIITSASTIGSFSSLSSPGLSVSVDANAQGLVLTVLGPPEVLSAVSRKLHGASGEFSIPLSLTAPAGVECRAAGAGGSHQVLVTFAQPVAVSGLSVSSANGLATINGSVSGAVVTLNLGNVANAQTLVIRLTNVTNGSVSGDVFISMRVLAGDTNGSGGVTATDIGQTKGASGQVIGASNFRLDVNVSGGSINASDIGLVKASSGTSVP